jgi:hypothetical protein
MRESFDARRLSWGYEKAIDLPQLVTCTSAAAQGTHLSSAVSLSRVRHQKITHPLRAKVFIDLKNSADWLISAGTGNLL